MLNNGRTTACFGVNGSFARSCVLPNPGFEIITRATDEHRLLVVTDEVGVRTLEPYLIGVRPLCGGVGA